jgi:mannose-6-phosphate isomerase
LSENRIQKTPASKLVFGGKYRHVSEYPSAYPSIVLTCDTFCFGNFLLNLCSVWKKLMIGPFRLAPYFSPRPWGSLDLSPWYPGQLKEPIGEAWLTGKDCVIENGNAAGSTLGQAVAQHADEILSPRGGSMVEREFPLLIKLLFPQEKLSVQVHPDDKMAQSLGEPRGKTECWYVLSAEPGASVALGFRPGTTQDSIRRGVTDHTLEEMLNWLPVSVGDMVYVDAGTVHAIGPGVVLLETQQYSDSTYRLYDYGRPRELHVDQALHAFKLTTAAGKVPPVHHAGYDQLIAKQYFQVERHTLAAGENRCLKNQTGSVHILVALNGSARVESNGVEPVEAIPGRAVVVPASLSDYRLAATDNFTCVRAMPPGREKT